jgi:hypothetical protein
MSPSTPSSRRARPAPRPFKKTSVSRSTSRWLSTSSPNSNGSWTVSAAWVSCVVGAVCRAGGPLNSPRKAGTRASTRLRCSQNKPSPSEARPGRLFPQAVPACRRHESDRARRSLGWFRLKSDAWPGSILSAGSWHGPLQLRGMTLAGLGKSAPWACRPSQSKLTLT